MEKHSVKAGSTEGSGRHYHEAKKVTLVSVGVNVVLTALQIVIGIIGKSQVVAVNVAAKKPSLRARAAGRLNSVIR